MSPPVGYPDYQRETTNSGWATEGALVNPPINTLLAQTPALPGGFYDLLFMIHVPAAIAAPFDIRHKAAGGASTLHSQYIRVPANSSITINIPGTMRIADNEYFEIYTRAAITGTLRCGIVYRRFPE